MSGTPCFLSGDLPQVIHTAILPLLLFGLVAGPLPRPRKVLNQPGSDSVTGRSPGAQTEWGLTDATKRLEVSPQSAFDAGRQVAQVVFAEMAEGPRAMRPGTEYSRRSRVMPGSQQDQEEQRCVEEANRRSEDAVSEACSTDSEHQCEDARRRSADQLEADIALCAAEGNIRRMAAQRAREARAATWEERKFMFFSLVILGGIAYGGYHKWIRDE